MIKMSIFLRFIRKNFNAVMLTLIRSQNSTEKRNIIIVSHLTLLVLAPSHYSFSSDPESRYHVYSMTATVFCLRLLIHPSLFFSLLLCTSSPRLRPLISVIVQDRFCPYIKRFFKTKSSHLLLNNCSYFRKETLSWSAHSHHLI